MATEGTNTRRFSTRLSPFGSGIEAFTVVKNKKKKINKLGDPQGANQIKRV